MSQPRAADDFATIRARMEELRRERETAGSNQGGRPSAIHADERRRRERIEGWPPPWVPTIFIRKARP